MGAGDDTGRLAFFWKEEGGKPRTWREWEEVGETQGNGPRVIPAACSAPTHGDALGVKRSPAEEATDTSAWDHSSRLSLLAPSWGRFGESFEKGLCLSLTWSWATAAGAKLHCLLCGLEGITAWGKAKSLHGSPRRLGRRGRLGRRDADATRHSSPLTGGGGWGWEEIHGNQNIRVIPALPPRVWLSGSISAPLGCKIVHPYVAWSYVSDQNSGETDSSVHWPWGRLCDCYK